MDRRKLLKTTIAATAATALPIADTIAPIIAAPAASPIMPINSKPYINYVFEWFVSYDGEVYYEGFATRDEAERYAKQCGYSLIAECKPQDFDIRIYGGDIIERLNEDNYELIGEDDGIICTSEQEGDLTKMLTRAFEAWVVKHNIDIRAWSFDTVRNQTAVAPQDR
jgi:hypothetical protein